MDRILNEKGEIATTSRRWAHRWIKREHKFLKTLRSKPLSYLRKQAHVKEDIENHFKEFQRCKSHYAIEDEDCYNFDETGCPIGITVGSTVIVPTGISMVYVDDPDNKELVTVTVCISTGGYAVPPMIIFKGAYHLRKYFDVTTLTVTTPTTRLASPPRANHMASDTVD